MYTTNGRKDSQPDVDKRFDVNIKKEGPEVTPLGRAKVNGKEVEGSGGQTYEQKTNVQQENIKGIEKSDPETSLYLKRNKPPAPGKNEALQRKGTSPLTRNNQ